MKQFLQCLLPLLLITAASIPAQIIIDTTRIQCGSTLLFKNNLVQDIGMVGRLSQMTVSVPGHGSNTTSNSPPSGTYIIPVVFHVITDLNNPTIAPSYAQIQMQLASLNAAFSNNLPSLNNMPAGSRAVNTNIQFCFAKKIWVNSAQAAWPTSSVGVVYHTVTNTLTSNIDITNNTSLATLSALTNAQYPPSMYLNIWCVPNISTSGNTNVNAPPGVIGMGTFPWMTMPIDGIVMRNDCIGNNTYNSFPGTMFSYLDKGNILVHEAGHYLGLFHTFETIVNANAGTSGGAVGCYGLTNQTTDGDLIFDTPPTMINGQVQPGPYNTCNESYFPYGPGPGADVNDQLENFMSYSDDDYMNTFTNKQAERMWGALDNIWTTTFLNGQRANLVSSTNLTNTGVSITPACGPGLLTSAFTSSLIVASITCSSAAVKFLQPLLPGYLSATTHTWYFGDGTNSNAVNPVHNYNIAPCTFTVMLIVSNTIDIDTMTQQVNIPCGIPEIVDWSGKNNPVCLGTEQTIFINFPPYTAAAVITDGITSYVVQPDVMVGVWLYTFPFTFTITNSGTWSLSLGSCITSTSVASFTVVDCCSNLLYNGSMEAGPVGFTSQYTLTTNNYFGGNAAVGPPLGMFPPTLNQTGKQFMVDSYGITGCLDSNIHTLLVGYTVTGLQPSTNYYLAFKCGQSADSGYYICATKFNLKFYHNATQLLNKNIRPSNGPNPYSIVPGGTGKGWLQVYNFMVTTPSTINATTVFSLELYEVENRQGIGFDDVLDEFILSRMNGALSISPLTSTISSCPGSTVQLHTISNCSNIANYTLVWQPSANLSCSTCANPVASVSVTTVYTLIAIPPITIPPSPNIVFTNTVFTNGPMINITTMALPPCNSPSYSLTVTNALTATWQPGNITSLNIVVPAINPITYSVTTNMLSNQQTCISHTTIQLSIPVIPVITATSQKKVVCKGESVNLTGHGAISYTWSTLQTGSFVSVTPTQNNTTYTVIGADGSGCLSNVASVIVKISNCTSINEQETTQEFLTIFPNPNTGQFIVRSNTELKLNLFNSLGQMIRNFTLQDSNDYSFELTDLSNGIYFISGNKNNKSFIEKVVVIK